MNNFRSTATTVALWTVFLGLVALVLAASAEAQAPKKKKAAPAATVPHAPPKKKPEDKEPAKPKKETEKDKEADATTVPLLEEERVRAVLESKPSTPEDLVTAGRVLASMERPELAKGFFGKVLDADLNEQQLLKLADKVGTEVFLDLQTREDTAPEGKRLADAVLAAKARQLQSPEHKAALLKDLQNASLEIRARALLGLQELRGAGVVLLLGVVADPKRAAEHENVRAALAAFGADAVGPLTAALESSDPKVVAEALRALDAIRSRAAMLAMVGALALPLGPEPRAAAEEALKRSLGRVPAPAEAAEILAEQARRYFNRQQPMQTDSKDRIEVWSWNAAAKEPVATLYPADAGGRLLAARLARQAAAIRPDDEPIRRLSIKAVLEEAAYANGLDKPLAMDPGSPAAWSAQFGPRTLEQVLVEVLDAGHPAAAAAVAGLLGQVGKPETVLYAGLQPTPLVRAIRHPDLRVRMAALEAVLGLHADRPFPGASYIPEALCFFASWTPRRAVLVAAPRIEEAKRVSGFLVQLHYQPETVTTGRELLLKAAAGASYDFVLMDDALEQPEPALLLQELRHDARTAGLPVGLLARADRVEHAEHVAGTSPRTEAFARPHELAAAAWQVGRLVAMLGPEYVPLAERRRHALWAMDKLGGLTARDRGIFDLTEVQRVALAGFYVPDLSAKASYVLGNLGTPPCQQALVELADQAVEPVDVRKAAASAFRVAILRRGLLLTTVQIRRQYELYNEAAKQDAATQQVLGHLLDSIELPRTPVTKTTSPR